MSSLIVNHFFTSFRSLGGVEAVLKHHYDQDAIWDLQSEFFIFFEGGGEVVERVHFLGFSGNTTIGLARLRLTEALGTTLPDFAIYHGMWGMPHFVELDRAHRRLLILHGHVPLIEYLLRQRVPWVDGVLCVSEPLRTTVRETVPKLEDWRIEVLPYPISPPGDFERRPKSRDRELVIGFCGRVAVEQKRIDRIPPLVKLLVERNVAFRLEILGDGPDCGWLRNELGDGKRCYFHGRKSGKDYWRALAGWDVIVFLSDYEGTPIALLEALSQGVIPVFPAINSGGDECTQKVDSRLVYKAGDLRELADRIEWIVKMDDVHLVELRHRCRRAVSDHTVESYMSKFATFARSIHAAPAVAGKKFPKGRWLIEGYSFATLEKLSNLRRRLRGAFRSAGSSTKT